MLIIIIAFASELEKMKFLFHKLTFKLDLSEQKKYIMKMVI